MAVAEKQGGGVMGLKPCPWCGRDATVTEFCSTEWSGGWRWRVDCSARQKCGANGPVRKVRDTAIHVWNRRSKRAERAAAVEYVRAWASVGRTDLYGMAGEMERGEHREGE